jgi:hypothetical protein
MVGCFDSSPFISSGVIMFVLGVLVDIGLVVASLSVSAAALFWLSCAVWEFLRDLED